MDAPGISRVSIAEYQQIEKDAGQKYEYHNGYLFALAGGTIPHGMICGNIYAELRKALEKKGDDCTVFTSEIKLHIATQNAFVYPDAMVICDELETSELDQHAITNPMVIVEVLSKNTAAYDRGEKFHKYRQIAELRLYVLIEQEKPAIELFYRKNQKSLWQIERIEGREQTIYFPGVDIEIPMNSIYKGVNHHPSA